MSIMQLPGGICFAHGPYRHTIGCPQWPCCATDPQKPEYIELARVERERAESTKHPPLSPEMKQAIAEEIEVAKKERSEVSDMNCYAAGFADGYRDALLWVLSLAEEQEGKEKP